jgi:hypothetical protein
LEGPETVATKIEAFTTKILVWRVDDVMEPGTSPPTSSYSLMMSTVCSTASATTSITDLDRTIVDRVLSIILTNFKGSNLFAIKLKF